MDVTGVCWSALWLGSMVSSRCSSVRAGNGRMGTRSAAIKSSALFKRVDWARCRVRLATKRSQSVESSSVVDGDGAVLLIVDAGELVVSVDEERGDGSIVGVHCPLVVQQTPIGRERLSTEITV